MYWMFTSIPSIYQYLPDNQSSPHPTPPPPCVSGVHVAQSLNYLVDQSFDFEGTWWRLFQKSVVFTEFVTYVFNMFHCLSFCLSYFSHLIVFLLLAVSDYFFGILKITSISSIVRILKGWKSKYLRSES